MPTTPLNDTAPRIQYEANAGQTEFTFPFWITAENDLAVYVASTLKELTTDYSVTGILNTNGGTVTFNAGLNDGDIVTIERAMPFERASEFQEAGTFKASVLNLELSKMVAMMQQIKGDINRKLGLSTTSLVNAANLVLPDPQDGKALIFDGTGGAMRTSNVNVDDIDGAVIDAQNAASTATSARDTALQAQTDAQAAETNAETAQSAAETARDEAVTTVGNVLVSGADTTAGKLSDKIDGGEIINAGGDEKLKIASGTDPNLLLSNWEFRSNTAASGSPSITWSPELEIFCTVGGSSTTNNAISSDGVNWTRQTVSDLENGVSDVVWSPELSLFVAVKKVFTSSIPDILSSPDGLTWTVQSNVGDSPWTAVAWSPELSLFVAVGSGGPSGKTATSPDGVNWTRRPLGINSENEALGITWSSELGLFVVVGFNHAGGNQLPSIYSSSDGINWTTHIQSGSFDSGIRFIDVEWSPELSIFVAVGKDRILFTSPDGTNWTQQTFPAPSTIILTAVAWSPELKNFCVTASDNNIDNHIFTSTDGINWVARSTEQPNWSDVAWSPKLNMFVAVRSKDSLTSLISNEGI